LIASNALDGMKKHNVARQLKLGTGYLKLRMNAYNASFIKQKNN
jgi:hypothetical protein